MNRSEPTAMNGTADVVSETRDVNAGHANASRNGADHVEPKRGVMDHPPPNAKLPRPRPAIGGAAAGAAPRAGVVPPRPASGAMPSVNAHRVIKAQSDPPPSDRTQAYAQDVLPRLLSEADRRTLSEYEARMLGNTDDHSATVSRSDLPDHQTARSESVRLPHTILRKDTIPDTDELTTAYVRPSSKAPAFNPRAEENFTGVNSADDERLAATSRDEESTVSVSIPTVMADNALEVHSERTGPAILRKSSLRPAMMPRTGMGRPLRLGILAVVCAGLVLSALAFSRWRPTKDDAFAGLPRATKGFVQATFGRFAEKAPPVAPPEPRFVELSVTVDPPQAQLFLDGRAASN
ncbi:MAG TPA: hypothetical protein VIV60_03190, partial [Polyangiaceae bacterium]